MVCISPCIQRLTAHNSRHSLETYGAKVDQLKSEIGYPVTQAEIEQALKAKKYKILTVTHVDTSTGADGCFEFVTIGEPDAFLLFSGVERCESNRSYCTTSVP